MLNHRPMGPRLRGVVGFMKKGLLQASLVGVNALCSLHCFNVGGWPIKYPISLVSRGSLPERMEEKPTQGHTFSPITFLIPWNCPFSDCSPPLLHPCNNGSRHPRTQSQYNNTVNFWNLACVYRNDVANGVRSKFHIVISPAEVHHLKNTEEKDSVTKQLMQFSVIWCSGW